MSQIWRNFLVSKKLGTMVRENRLATVLSVLCLCALTAAISNSGIVHGFAGTADDASRSSATCPLTALWSLSCQGEPLYRLLDPLSLSVPPELLGLCVDKAGHLFIADRIANRLVKYSPDGDLVFETGSIGPGPEDILDPAEPILWPGAHVGWYDLSNQAKVVCYDAGGHYSGSHKLSGAESYVRLWPADGHVVGLGMNMEYGASTGLEGEVFLVVMDDNGSVRNRRSLTKVKLPSMRRDVQYNERDFEIWPRLAVAAGGNRLFIQRDLYALDIECWNLDLELEWRYTEEISARRRTAAELRRRKEILRGPEPYEFEHVISKMIARDDGSLWICRHGEFDPAAGSAHITVISGEGHKRGSITLQGLPDILGDFAVFGQYLVWKADDDAIAESQAEPLPYLTLYRMGCSDEPEI